MKSTPIVTNGQEVFGLAAVTEFTGFSKSTIYQAIRQETLLARKLGRRTVVFRRDLLEWLNSLPLKTGASAIHAERARKRWNSGRSNGDAR